MNDFLVFCCGLFLICISVAVVLMVGFPLGKWVEKCK